MEIPERKVIRRVLSDGFFLTVVALGLFLAHFYLNWHVSGPDLTYDYVSLIVEPYHLILSGDVGTALKYLNPWQGFLIIYFPFIAVLGHSPFVLRTLSSFFWAATTPVLYLLYYRFFDCRYRALAMTLILLTMSRFIFFRSPEMPPVLFLSSLSILLFVEWWKRARTSLLYLSGFIAGFAVYTKYISFYLLFPFLLAFLMNNLRESMERIGHREVAFGVLALAAGFSPELLHLFRFDDFAGHLIHVLGYTPMDSLADRMVFRLNQLFRVVKSPFWFFSFQSWEVLGLAAEIKWNAYSVLVLTGSLISLKMERFRTFSWALLFTFLVSLKSVHSKPALHQMFIIFPLVPVIIWSNLEYVIHLLPLEDKKELVKVSLLPLLALALSTGAFLVDYDHTVDRHFTQEEYSALEDAGVEGEVATNYVHGLRLLMTMNTEGHYMIAREEWEYPLTNPEFVRGMNWSLEKYREGEISLLLWDTDMPCNRSEFTNNIECGYRTERMLKYIERESAEVINLGRHRYLYFESKRNADLE